MTAPVIGGSTIALAVALVWYLRPQPQESHESAEAAPAAAERAAEDATPRVGASSAPQETAAAPIARNSEPAAGAVADATRSPLPGETPATPMAQLLADRQQNMIVRDAPGGAELPPGLVEGEREFAAEPVDGTWAPGAEAKLLATFAQMPGLKLIDLQVECRSTMCRLQFTQPPMSARPGGELPFNILRDEVGLTPRWMMAVVEGNGPPGPPRPGDAPRPMKSIAYLWREGFAPERQAGAPHEPN
jgi:hypothetical protein